MFPSHEASGDSGALSLVFLRELDVVGDKRQHAVGPLSAAAPPPLLSTALRFARH